MKKEKSLSFFHYPVIAAVAGVALLPILWWALVPIRALGKMVNIHLVYYGLQFALFALGAWLFIWFVRRTDETLGALWFKLAIASLPLGIVSAHLFPHMKGLRVYLHLYAKFAQLLEWPLEKVIP